MEINPQNKSRIDAEKFGVKELDTMINEAYAGISRVLSRIRRPQARAGTVGSPIGKLFFAESDSGIVAIQFLFNNSGERTIARLRKKFELIENEPATRRFDAGIRRYFGGDIAIKRRPVDLSLIDSDFQRRALERLREVPDGAVISYSGLAAAAGNPSSQRAIGNTMATNPVPIFVPCHRVVRSDGSIGNYGGGVPAKVKLLRTEGFTVGSDLRVGPNSVVGNRGTRIFCRPECSAAARAESSHQLIFANAKHATRAGMRPCKVCRPG
ncbi:MAG TPA: methylated-DNA--[protein]-cysteine S-methyltransferase [Candidatus Binataceae bacterium]|nr:methylated-DNA--[protein]-cysteine S-methyltransferase [Candidatus Binataceae bacterium]